MTAFLRQRHFVSHGETVADGAARLNRRDIPTGLCDEWIYEYDVMCRITVEVSVFVMLKFATI